MDIAVNYVAVLLAAIASYAVGALWHSPVGFGKQWMHMMGLTADKMRSMPLTATQAMIIGFFVTLLVAFVFALFKGLVGAETISLSLQLGFWVWLGFLAPTLANGWLWEGKSFKLLAFNAAYQLVSIEVIALVLALM
jgi:hypothetical protein